MIRLKKFAAKPVAIPKDKLAAWDGTDAALSVDYVRRTINSTQYTDDEFILRASPSRTAKTRGQRCAG